MKEHYKISELISRKILKNISKDEDEYLNIWIKKSDSNRAVVENVSKRIKNPDKELFYNNKIVDEDWYKVSRGLEERRYFIIRRICGLAASLLIIFSLSYLVYTSFNTSVTDNVQLAHTITRESAQKAFLILDDGNKISVSDIDSCTIEQGGTILSVRDNKLTYNRTGFQSENQNATEKYNTLMVPNGGEYSFVMSDGTKVWVNAGSKLKYPVNFQKSVREVFLDGEAYFKVKKNRHKPFIVRTTDNTKIKVLGTEFNVCAYSKEYEETTTLLSGKVQIIQGVNRLLLKPDEQVILDKQSGLIKKKIVDAYKYASWKDGKFIFENSRLENIMIKLSRWYDVEVFYVNEEVKEYHFTGDLERYSDINTILRMIEQSANIKFSINKKSVVVSKT